MDYIIHVFIMMCIYVMLVASLDLLAGHSGLLSLSHAAFFGIGSYTSAIVVSGTSLGFLSGSLAGALVACIVALIVSIPSLRLHDEYFAITTFAFQMILWGVFNNWQEVTRGAQGFSSIPRPWIFGWHVSSELSYLILALLFAALSFFVVRQLSRSPFGRVLHAIREDEVFAKSLRKNTVKFKVIAFTVSAMFAALAGSLFAHYITFVSPTSFTVSESIVVLSMVIIGGAGSRWGPLVGPIILVALPEALRFLGLQSADVANVRQIIYGLALVAIVMVRPRGLAKGYSFNR